CDKDADGNITAVHANIIPDTKSGTPVRVVCDIGAVRATAAAVDAEQRAQRQRDAEDAIAADPFVQALVRDFAATVVPGSIQPHAH
ncbi:hypothetical protein ACQCRI_11810, partial [Ralstonia pseudosolanacearum]|uniref:hypothetical protein n=1 Tax=Ralstonia pseudosolanacearum TaxID=1310165 RepID=UPI003CEB0C75